MTLTAVDPMNLQIRGQKTGTRVTREFEQQPLLLRHTPNGHFHLSHPPPSCPYLVFVTETDTGQECGQGL